MASTSASSFLLSLAVVALGLAAGQLCRNNVTTFVFESFDCFEDRHLKCTGDCISTADGKLNLTSYDMRSWGRVMYGPGVRLMDPVTSRVAFFSTNFTFSMKGDYSKPGEGLAFVMQANPSYQGRGGGFLGLYDKDGNAGTPTVAVEFDTYREWFYGFFMFNDVNSNHVGVDIESINSKVQADAGSVGIDLGKEQSVTAWIDYIPSSKHFDGNLQVRISADTVRPPLPLISYSVDLSKHIAEIMYLGFSATTGDHFVASDCLSYHNILSWSFHSWGLDPDSPPPVPPPPVHYPPPPPSVLPPVPLPPEPPTPPFPPSPPRPSPTPDAPSPSPSGSSSPVPVPAPVSSPSPSPSSSETPTLSPPSPSISPPAPNPVFPPLPATPPPNSPVPLPSPDSPIPSIPDVPGVPGIPAPSPSLPPPPAISPSFPSPENEPSLAPESVPTPSRGPSPSSYVSPPASVSPSPASTPTPTPGPSPSTPVSPAPASASNPTPYPVPSPSTPSPNSTVSPSSAPPSPTSAPTSLPALEPSPSTPSPAPSPSTPSPAPSPSTSVSPEPAPASTPTPYPAPSPSTPSPDSTVSPSSEPPFPTPAPASRPAPASSPAASPAPPAPGSGQLDSTRPTAVSIAGFALLFGGYVMIVYNRVLSELRDGRHSHHRVGYLGDQTMIGIHQP